MAVIRQGARDWLARRRIYALPLLVVSLGLTGFATGSGPVFRALCAGVVLLGLALFVAFRQQEVLRRSGDAPGVVEVDEARITYLAPGGGQIVDRDGLLSVTLEVWAGAAEWVLEHEAGPPLEVPLAARGADGLSALIEALPGVELSAARTALEAGKTGTYPVWRRTQA